MTLLVVFALGAVLLTALVVFLAYMRVSVLENRSRKSQNIAIYQQRLSELEVDVAQQRLEQAEYEAAKEELDATLLDDVTDDNEIAGQGSSKAFASGLGIIMVIVIGGYFWLGGAPQVDRWQQAQQKLPEFGYRAVMQQGEPLSDEEMIEFALALRTKLASEPDDAVAWLLLGRVAYSMRDINSAIQAFDKALALDATHLGANLSLAQVLIMSGQEGSFLRANQLLMRARSVHKEDTDLIALHAMVMAQLGHTQQAINDWEWLLTKEEPGSPRYNSISQRLAQARQGGDDALPAGHPVIGAAHGQAVAESSAPASDLPVSPEQIEVTVDLAEHVVSDNPVLFVFAQIANGPKMPVAVKKMRNIEFPLTVTLSDEDAMVPNLKLSGQASVVITARLSADENVAASTGEWEGKSSAIDPKSVEQLQVIINTEVN